ncbi:MAG: purine-nucleoside phosphorylase [Ureaplasma sp.]|nr:purine-nucleoside phosphorylase [Ureaplasma sp.]MDE7221714.1 purine-nucleoside phosphorylase [Ureaplasma sp.]
MTPHNNARKEDIAKVVLMPGDPLRAKWIAENFLENAKCVQDVRGMFAFTGTYKNKRITIMAHGMGIPSIGIYSYELFKFYDVDTIIRIGSTGSYSQEVKVNDVVLVDEAFSESTYANLLNLEVKNQVIDAPSKDLNKIIEETAKELNINLIVGRCHSSDVFYRQISLDELVKTTKSICVEMEAFALFANAKILNKNAATILTCSDSLVTGESLDPELRQKSFKKMVLIALESAIKYI